MSERVFALPEARQARSRASQARFVEAANRLLSARAWEDISIEDIVEEADLSIGAFYKRFRAKDDVLAAFIEHALEEGRSQTAILLAVKGRLPERVRALVDKLAKGWTVRANVVRAAKALRSAAHIAALRAESSETQKRIAEWLLERREDFGHPNPETAINMAFALPLSALQALLMSGRTAGQELIVETSIMLVEYFGCAD
jgi:AcrR family transcriptional regulator